MSEIKTTCQGTSRLIEAATMTYEEYSNLHTQGAEELRAAYEELEQKNAAQAKRIEELEQAASINQEYVTEMHRINGMAINAGLKVPNPNSPYFSERSAIAYLQRQSYEQGGKDGNNNVKLMDHKD